MSFVLRAVQADDLTALYQMAKRTGGGFTNLPPNLGALQAKIAQATASFARPQANQGNDVFLFILEDASLGKARGTCQVFARIGSDWPFYSYRLSTLTQVSKALDRTFRAETLTLSTDLDGSSEVGGLWLDPPVRSAGTGALLARSRYLFMKLHRDRFAERTIAELRGAHDAAGGSAFWDGLAGRFFGMSFREADDFNAVHGNQFIADLMPRHPIYTSMLPEPAQAVIGVPHKAGRAAMRMLENEGFAYRNYIDIFDGGPTLTVETDQIATIRQSQTGRITALGSAGHGIPSIVAHGLLAGFRACHGSVAPEGDGIMLDEAAAGLLGVTVGDTICHVAC